MLLDTVLFRLSSIHFSSRDRSEPRAVAFWYRSWRVVADAAGRAGPLTRRSRHELIDALQIASQQYTLAQSHDRLCSQFPEMRCDGIVCAPLLFREEPQERRGSLAGTARGDVEASRWQRTSNSWTLA